MGYKVLIEIKLRSFTEVPLVHRTIYQVKTECF